MEKGFVKQEVVKSFDSWRRSSRVIPVGATQDRRGKPQEPRYGYLNFEDPDEQALIDLADAYLALKEAGVDLKKAMAVDDEDTFDPQGLKTMTQLFADPNAKKKIHNVILSCYPDIRRIHQEALEVHLAAGQPEEEFVSPLESFKPFRKLALLGAAGEQLNS